MKRGEPGFAWPCQLTDIMVELWRGQALKPTRRANRNFPVGHDGPCRAVVDAGLSTLTLFPRAAPLRKLE